MKHVATPAIILKRIDFGEADRIITIITPDYGKISILAKGVRKAKSKLAGGLELFSISDITYIDGKSDLKVLISAQLNVHFRSIVTDISRTMVAYDFLKYIDSHTHESCEKTFYELLESSLRSLNDHHDYVGVASAWFFARILMHLGTSINVDSQVDGRPFTESTMYTFSFDDMGFIGAEVGSFNPHHIKFLRLLIRADKPEHLLHVANAPVLSEDLMPVLKKAVDFQKH